MKLPSFKVQILVIIALLLLISGYITHAFFINSFRDYEKDMNSFDLYKKTHNFYLDNKDVIDKEEMRDILQSINQSELTTYLFERRMTQISTSYLIVSSIIFFLIFFVLLHVLSRPLIRLRKATKKVRAGDLNVRVKENRISPINHLIVSFNEMVKELEANRDKLLKAEKDMMWREMAQVVAHEIKNPLTPLQLSIERLEIKYEKCDNENFNKTFAESLSVIHEEIDNLKHLVQEFSRFARMPSSNYEFYDIHSQVQEIIKPYKESANIYLEIKNSLPKFYGDKLQIKQVFVNLLQNAMDALDKNGKIFVKLNYEDNKFMFTIRDTGKGLSKQEKSEIFRPYYTTKEKGTGLGLAIVRRIIKQHQGEIKVNSKKGAGTVFVLTFTEHDKKLFNDNQD
ncbi:MAG: HAMP domain-containing histidine kinase [Candidatus Cloacimonetes bacterium]|nr:HAMP domain-containing histidine kinase [Candidatus Cloacimonadota bacterium]MBS3766702.1 HAMP domain-containing histidine kinase [Candidatus Cloacimonadota bacterium]